MSIKILNKINQFVSDELLFTAYDVTKALRADGNFITHSEVKTVLANYNLSLVGYNVTLSNWSDSDSVSPYIYHPKIATSEIITQFGEKLESKNTPVSYDFLKTLVSKINESKIKPHVEPEMLGDESKVTDVEIIEEVIKLIPDSRQRCTIPNRIVLSCFSVGDLVSVWYDQNEDITYVVRDNKDDDLRDTTLTVDRSGNIRIPVLYLPTKVDETGSVKVIYDDTGITIE